MRDEAGLEATAAMAAITGGETLLVLAANPGDETLFCGGLIARCCRLGRPPYVMVLTDGGGGSAEVAARRERATRAAAERLGLARERLLMVGLFDGTVPSEGPVFEAVVRAVTLVMWARDCNVVCAPAPSAAPHHAAAARAAAAVAERSGVRRVGYGAGQGAGWVRLPVDGQAAVKRAALALHGLREPDGWEAFLAAP